MNHEQGPIQMTQNNKHNKWVEIFDFQPKLLWRTPTKIHRERIGEDDDNKKPCTKHREHRLAQRRQRRQHRDHKHVQKQRQNNTITLQIKPMNRGNTDCRRLKKRWEDQAMLTVHSKIIFSDATIGSNSYTICTMHVKNIFPMDWGQPISLYTRSNIGFYSKLYFTMNSL